MFVLAPVVRPDLPDTWVPTTDPATGGTYYVNHARQQSSWALPPGL
jgi:hypothetical protein